MKTKRNDKETKSLRIAFLPFLFAIVLLPLAVFLVEKAELPPVLVYGGALILYSALLFASVVVYRNLSVRNAVTAASPTLSEAISGAASKTVSPAALIDADEKILWCNAAFTEATKRRTVLVGDPIEKAIGFSMTELSSLENKDTVVLGVGTYAVEMLSLPDGLTYLSFSATGELLALRKTLESSAAVVAYIALDNIDEILQFVQDRFSKCAEEVEEKLHDWISDMNGILRPYSKNKFIAVFDHAGMERVLADRFSILDDVRNVRVGDGLSVTVSMGIADFDGTLAEKEKAAAEALDLALQRGGDQVVTRTAAGTNFYGGRTKAIYKQNSVQARVIGSKLASLIGRADNVLIMGHRFGDFDSFGASVGIARFASACGVKANIVVNFADENLTPCFAMVAGKEEFRGLFVDGSVGFDRIRKDTLLILVDVNNFDNVEYPAVLRNIQNVVVIDHHRKTADFAVKPLVTYIETSASSASELVGEILEQMLSAKSLLREEAELLLAGILLDTQQFTRNTGTRTFGVARYLRGEGADLPSIGELFKTDITDVIKEAHFQSHIHLYRGIIAIAACPEEGDVSYRPVAAKAADKLLGAKNVEAAFSLVRIAGKVHISARSSGRINVQLILEKLHGGGHFDVAGAQVESESVYKAVELLKEAIDDYLDNEADYRNFGENGE